MIDDIPKLEKDIKVAFKDKKLIIFFGAGISVLIGCKRWKDMANSLMYYCYNKDKFDYWVYQNLKRNYSPRKLITMAKDKLDKVDYDESIKKALEIKNEESNESYMNIYEKLKQLDKGTVFITTNIDTHFSDLFDNQNVFCKADQFLTQNISPGKMFHLHGKFNDEIVLTIDEYVERYNQDQVKVFLKTIFQDNEYLKLFMGYGLDELELIDYMVTKAEESDGQQLKTRKSGRIKVLLPFFNAEEIMLEYEKKYFQRLNIEVIPYAIDKKGYSQIYYVLDSWIRELIDKEDEFYKNIQLIDEVL